MLEFDKSNPLFSHTLLKIREDQAKKSQKKKNKVLGFMSSVMGNVADLGKGLANVTKGLAN